MSNTAGIRPRDTVHSPAKRHPLRKALWVLALGLVLASGGAGLPATLRSGPVDEAAATLPPTVREAASVGGQVMSAPSPPRNLTAEGGDGMVTLTWQEPADDGGLPVLGYNIYRGTSSGGEEFLIAVLLVTTYIDVLGIENGVTYYYQVTAFNPEESGRSNEASATPGGAPTVPGPPRDLNATAGNATVILTWSAPTDDGGSPITNYYIYRGIVSGGEVFLDSVADVLTYTDTAVMNGVTYYYQVSAKNDAGEGPLADEASATPNAPQTPPEAPESLVATAGDGRVTLTWSAPPDDGGSPITNYNVYRGIVSGGELILETVGNVLTYTDTLVINGVTYYYKVSAKNDVGEGPLSNEASATPQSSDQVPGAPENLVAAAGDATVSLEWSAPADDGGSPITNYNLHRGTSPGGESLYKAVGNVLSYLDSDVLNGVTYYYKVSAENDVGEGVLSNEASATPIGVPGAPQNLRATAGDRTVTLDWSPPGDNGGSPITNYNLYRGTSPGGESPYKEVGNVLSYSDNEVSNGVTYYYNVSAVNSVGEGALSDEVSATPESVPDAPRDLSAIGGNRTVTLAWNAPVSDGGTPIINYNIYRGTSPGPGSLIATVEVRSFLDSEGENGVTYFYQVTAVNDVGEGPPSDEASATPATVPGAPQNPRAFPGDRRVTIQWSGPESDGGAPVTNYRIYRGTTPGSTTLLETVESVTSYSDEGLTNDVTYYYRVSAVNRVDEGPPSVEVSATPTPEPTAPDEPQSLVAAPGDSSVSLTWLPPAGNGGSPVLSYNVYRGWRPDHLDILAPGGTAHSLWDGGVMNGETYYYAVAAVNAVGEGPRTGPVAATPNGPGPDVTKPTIVITTPTSGATVTYGTITVSGSASDDVGVAGIAVSADGTTWIEGSGTDSWTATLNLTQGDRTIYARATDAAGNSEVATVSVSVTGTEGAGGVEPTPTGGGDPGPGLVLMAILSFALAGGIAWFVLNRRRKS